jgi:hypothetical protein
MNFSDFSFFVVQNGSVKRGLQYGLGGQESVPSEILKEIEIEVGRKHTKSPYLKLKGFIFYIIIFLS